MTRAAYTPPADPLDTGDHTAPEDAWALTPADIYIGGHWYELRPWLAVRDRVGRHLVERCCPDEEGSGGHDDG